MAEYTIASSTHPIFGAETGVPLDVTKFYHRITEQNVPAGDARSYVAKGIDPNIENSGVCIEIRELIPSAGSFFGSDILQPTIVVLNLAANTKTPCSGATGFRYDIASVVSCLPLIDGATTPAGALAAYAARFAAGTRSPGVNQFQATVSLNDGSGGGSAPPGTGTVTTGANVGGGGGDIFRDVTGGGSTMNFRSIGAGAGVVFDTTSVTDQIIIKSDPNFTPSGEWIFDDVGSYLNPPAPGHFCMSEVVPPTPPPNNVLCKINYTDSNGVDLKSFLQNTLKTGVAPRHALMDSRSLLIASSSAGTDNTTYIELADNFPRDDQARYTDFVAGQKYTLKLIVDPRSADHLLTQSGNDLATVAVGSNQVGGDTDILAGAGTPAIKISKFSPTDSRIRNDNAGGSLVIQTVDASLTDPSGSVTVASGWTDAGGVGDVILATGITSGGGANGRVRAEVAGVERVAISATETRITQPVELTGLASATTANVLYHDTGTGLVTTGAITAPSNVVLDGGNPAATTLTVGPLSAPYNAFYDLLKFVGSGGKDVLRITSAVASPGVLQFSRIHTSPDTINFEFDCDDPTDTALAGTDLGFTAGLSAATNVRGGNVVFNASTSRPAPDNATFWGEVKFGVGSGNYGRSLILDGTRFGVLRIQDRSLTTPYIGQCTLPNDIPTLAVCDLRYATPSSLSSYLRNDTANAAGITFGSTAGGMIWSNSGGPVQIRGASSVVLGNVGGVGKLIVNLDDDEVAITTAMVTMANILPSLPLTHMLTFNSVSGNVTPVPRVVGAWAFEGNATSSGGTLNQWNWIQGTLTQTELVGDLTLTANNTLTYTGAVTPRMFKITYSATPTTTSNDRTAQIKYWKNPSAVTNPGGASVLGSRSTSILRTAINDTRGMAAVFVVSLATNDTLRAYVANTENNDAITVDDFSFVIEAL